MEITIYSMGNIEFLTQVMNAVAMVCGSGNYPRLVAVGFLVSLLFLGFQCIFQGAQRINLPQLVVCFIVYLCMFGPTCTVVLEDIYKGRVQNVDNVPLGVGVSGMAISNIGYGLTRMMEQGYGTVDRTTEHAFAEPLRLLNNLRSSDGMYNAINDSLGQWTAGRHSDIKTALTNYLSECTMVKVQLGGITVGELAGSPWGEAFHNTSDAHTTYLPIPGVTESGIVTCNQGFEILDNALRQGMNDARFAQAVNSQLSIFEETASINPTPSSTLDFLQAQLQSISVDSSNMQTLMETLLVNDVYHDAAYKYSMSMQDRTTAVAIRQAQYQRNSQWAAEGTMSLSSARALMAFFEGFLYAITPIMGFLLAIGSFGLALVGKYFLLIAWIQLWLPVLSITNLYVNTGIRTAIASIGNQVSMYGLADMWSQAETWIATGGMLVGATPIISLFLITGSTYAFTSLAGRLNGQDHYNEKISSPDAVQPAPVHSMASKYQNDRISGTRITGADGMLGSLQFGSQLTNVQTSVQNLLNSRAENALDTLRQGVMQNTSSAQEKQFVQNLGKEIADMKTASGETIRSMIKNTAYGRQISDDVINSAVGEGALRAGFGKTGGQMEGAAKTAASALSPDKIKSFASDIAGKVLSAAPGVGKVAGAAKEVADFIMDGIYADASVQGKSATNLSTGEKNTESYSTQNSSGNSERFINAVSSAMKHSIARSVAENFSQSDGASTDAATQQSYSELYSATRSYQEAQSLTSSLGNTTSVSYLALAEGSSYGSREAVARYINARKNDSEFAGTYEQIMKDSVAIQQLLDQSNMPASAEKAQYIASMKALSQSKNSEDAQFMLRHLSHNSHVIGAPAIDVGRPTNAGLYQPGNATREDVANLRQTVASEIDYRGGIMPDQLVDEKTIDHQNASMQDQWKISHPDMAGEQARQAAMKAVQAEPTDSYGLKAITTFDGNLSPERFSQAQARYMLDGSEANKQAVFKEIETAYKGFYADKNGNLSDAEKRQLAAVQEGVAKHLDSARTDVETDNFKVGTKHDAQLASVLNFNREFGIKNSGLDLHSR